MRKWLLVLFTVLTLMSFGIVLTACGEPEQASLHEHDFEWVVTKPASCTREGEARQECTICHEKGETRTTEKLAHTPVPIPDVAATCTRAGKTGGQKCSVCGTVLVEPTEQPKLDHTPGDEWFIGETGHYRVCTVCSTALEPEPHVEEKIDAIAPTCTTLGKTEGVKCSVCDAILTARQAVPMSAHTPCADWKQDSGVHYKDCTVCGTRLEEGIHLSSVWHADKGETVHYKLCDTCGERFGEEAHAEGLHTYNENGELKHADYCPVCKAESEPVACTLEWRSGVNQHWKECTTCGQTTARELHDAVTFAPSESDPNQHIRTCATCSDARPTDCTFIWQNDPSQESTSGWVHYHKCIFCERTTDPEDCTPVDDWTNSSSFHKRRCSVCNNGNFEFSGHTYRYEPNADGTTHTAICTVCDYTSPEPVPCTYHYEYEASELSLTGFRHRQVCDCGRTQEWEDCTAGAEYGSDASGHFHVCTACGNNQLDRSAHTYTQGKYTISTNGILHAALCDACGYAKTERCTITTQVDPAGTDVRRCYQGCASCGYVVEGSVHTHGENSTWQSMSVDGTSYHDRICSYCGQGGLQYEACSEFRNVIDPWNANLHDKVCSDCGAVISKTEHTKQWSIRGGTDGAPYMHMQYCTDCNWRTTEEECTPGSTYRYTGDGFHARSCIYCGNNRLEWERCDTVTKQVDGVQHSYTCVHCGNVSYSKCTYTWSRDLTAGLDNHIWVCRICRYEDFSKRHLSHSETGEYVGYSTVTSWGETWYLHRVFCSEEGCTLYIEGTFGECSGTEHRQSSTQEGYHDLVCEKCSQILETEKCEDKYPLNRGGQHYWHCSVCNTDYGFGDHEFGEWEQYWSYYPPTRQMECLKHCQVCKICKQKLNFEDHMPDENTPCQLTNNGHRFTCPTCGLENVVGPHTFAETYSYRPGPQKLHWRVCTAQGCTAWGDYEECYSTSGKWYSSGEGYHYRICDGCGKKIDAEYCTLSGYKPDPLNPGKHTAVCSVCGETSTLTCNLLTKPDPDDPAAHTVYCLRCGYSETEKCTISRKGLTRLGNYSADYHEFTCATCKRTVKAEHDWIEVYTGTQTRSGSLRCSVCDIAFMQFLYVSNTKVGVSFNATGVSLGYFENLVGGTLTIPEKFGTPASPVTQLTYRNITDSKEKAMFASVTKVIARSVTETQAHAFDTFTGLEWWIFPQVTKLMELTTKSGVFTNMKGYVVGAKVSSITPLRSPCATPADVCVFYLGTTWSFMNNVSPMRTYSYSADPPTGKRLTIGQTGFWHWEDDTKQDVPVIWPADTASASAASLPQPALLPGKEW